MIDYEKFRKSLRHLELQYTNLQKAGNRSELMEIDREAIGESVIQRFETCYDSLWKVLKRYLIEELGLTDVPNSPKPILKLAGANNLLSAPVEKWLEYADARTGTAHDYNEGKASEALSLIGDFIGDAVRLYHIMTGMAWE